MPIPTTPQVPTSSRLRGWYMSITPRARSSVLAPSLTRMASGRSLTTVRSAPSAPWKSIGAEFFIKRGAILAMFSSFLALTAPTQSAAGAGIPAQRSNDPDIRVHLLGLDVDLDDPLRSRLAPGLALAVRQKPVQASADQHHDVGVLEHR